MICGLVSLALLVRLVTFAVAGILDLDQPGTDPFATIIGIGGAMVFGFGGLIFLVPAFILLRRRAPEPEPGPGPGPIASPPPRTEPRL